MKLQCHSILTNYAATKHQRARQFVTGGNARFSVQNNRNTRYSYSILHTVKAHWYASVYTGGYWKFIGKFDPATGGISLNKQSQFPKSDKHVLVLKWALGYIWQDLEFPEGYDVQHEGMCCKCGKPLMSLNEVKRGIGDMCLHLSR
tara:strand:- start:2674 stop:3111 length:438 start_codon:yes stop_codon:yes gene_type:complete